MTVKTRTALKASMDTDLVDNVSADISAQDTRENMKDAADSAVFPEDPVGQLGAGTGWLSGGLVTINVDTTKFDYSDGSGVITDANDPVNITHTKISWTGASAITPSFIATDAVTFLAINSSGALIQSNTFPVDDGLRDLIQIGAVVHGDNVNINGTSDFVSAVPYQIAPSLTDLIIAIGVVQISGNDFSGSGNANLKFEKSAGKDFYFGIQAKVDPNNPNNILNILQNEPNITFSWRDGSGGFNTKLTDAITAGVYDDGTGGASDPNGSVSTNNWINCRIKYSPDADTIFLEYGTVVYSTSTNATNGITTDFFGDNPSFAGVPIRTYLSIRGAAADLDSSGDGIFRQTDRFGLLF